MRVLHIVGARPNFMKAAPVIAALNRAQNVSQVLVHTGQHYDTNMSTIFFQQLNLPTADINLEVGSGSHATQTALVMLRLEEVLAAQRPDCVLVYGDVNSTLAATLVCTKLQLKVGHVEAGLRSFDRSMPEEINRLLTDQVANLLFTPSIDGDQNLLREGIAPERIFRVGNVMIDTLVRLLPQAEHGWPDLRRSLGLSDNQPFALVTLHRPSNVDDPAMLARLVEALNDIAGEITIIFPVHPRTRQRLQRLPIGADRLRLQLIEPLGYLDCLALQRYATAVISDSGGIQEETTFLGVPCLTLRTTTERPVTVTVGTNIVIGQNPDRLRIEVGRILGGETKQGGIPELWDGKASQRIADIVLAQ